MIVNRALIWCGCIITIVWPTGQYTVAVHCHGSAGCREVSGESRVTMDNARSCSAENQGEINRYSTFFWLHKKALFSVHTFCRQTGKGQTYIPWCFEYYMALSLFSLSPQLLGFPSFHQLLWQLKIQGEMTGAVSMCWLSWHRTARTKGHCPLHTT